MEEQNRVTHRRVKTKKENAEMTFVEHLDQLRSHLIRAVLAVLLLAIVAFFFKDIIFNKIILSPKSSDFITNKLLCQLSTYLKTPSLCINQEKLNIVNIELAGQFKAHLTVSLVLGVILAFPYIIYELWRFVKPALKKKEFYYSKRMIFWVSLLFIIGVLFGYFVIVPLAVNFLATYNISAQVKNTINFASYFKTIITTAMGTGLVFEIPILAYVLAKIGIINDKLMKKYRKHAIVISFILSAIVTPPDAFSQILVVFPILGLYEFSIIIVKRVSKKRLISM